VTEDDHGDRSRDGERNDGGSAADVDEWEFADPQPPDGHADGDAGEAPLGALADRLRRREDRDAAGDTTEDPFEEVAVSEVDSEAVWEALETETTDEGVADPERDDPLAPDSTVERVDPDDFGTAAPEYLVPKRDYCHQCPHFSEPPAVACTHEGTDIVEVADHDHFRVRDCPVVDRSDDDR
jgi:hypothetical protein